MSHTEPSSRPAVSVAADAADAAGGPLAGIRIVDFGWVYAAPIATRTLADMGAETIKIEFKGHLDELRTSPSNTSGDIERDPVFHDINRNKQSVAIDFSDPRGAEIIKRLVAVSDVVVENYSPGVLDRKGLGYDVLRAIRPDLVMISMSAAGQWGPLHRIRTYGPSISALSGLDSMVGYPGERVLGSQGFYPDMVGAIHGVIAILAALWHRQNTARGQFIDLSQWEATVGMIGEAIVDYTFNGTIRGTQGNRNGGASPHGNYPCAGEDSWVAIAVTDEREWAAFADAIGNPPWTREPWAADRCRRVAHAEEVDAGVTAWTQERTADDAAQLLQAAGVAAAPSLHVGERYFHEHFAAREFHVDLDHPVTGVDIVSGIPWRLSSTPGRLRTPAPLYGQQTDHVLRDVLGCDDEEIAELVAAGVVEIPSAAP